MQHDTERHIDTQTCSRSPDALRRVCIRCKLHTSLRTLYVLRGVDLDEEEEEEDDLGTDGGNDEDEVGLSFSTSLQNIEATTLSI